MSFRLVPNSVTLHYFERRNSPNRRLISPNSVAFGADYVKVVEDTPGRPMTYSERELKLKTTGIRIVGHVGSSLFCVQD